jgi:hypothetical protein
MSSEEYKMMMQEFPVVYTQTRAYVMMVSADFYRDKVSLPDPNIKAFRSDLYMSPFQQQAGAVFDFIRKNADKFQDDDALQLFGRSQYNRQCSATDFVDGYSEPHTAGMRSGQLLGGHVDAQTIVVYQNPAQMRKVVFLEIAAPSMPTAAGPGSRAPPNSSRTPGVSSTRDVRASSSRTPGTGGSGWMGMQTLLETL